MDDYPTELEKLAHGPLVCHGCAHSASGAPYPGRPSGERPCCFCIRNVRREQWISEARADSNGGGHFAEGVYGVTFTPRYDNKPVAKVPLDCYIATDYLCEVIRG